MADRAVKHKFAWERKPLRALRLNPPDRVTNCYQEHTGISSFSPLFAPEF